MHGVMRKEGSGRNIIYSRRYGSEGHAEHNSGH